MRFILFFSEDLWAVHMKITYEKLISFMCLLVSKVRNIVSIRKLKTFWKSAKYQRAHFNCCNFTQKPDVRGTVKTSFLQALNTEVNSQHGRRAGKEEMDRTDRVLFRRKRKIPTEGKAIVKLMPNTNRKWRNYLNNLTNKTSKSFSWHDA